MANPPKDPKGSTPNIRDSGIPPEPSNPELPEWLRTDEWLKITPPPHEDPQESALFPAAEQTDKFRHELPENPEQGTELIEIIDEQDSGTNSPKHDLEDSLFITDDVQVISSPPSGIMPNYPEGVIPAPRSGKLDPKQNPVNEEDVDLSALFGETPSSGTPSSVLRRSGNANEMTPPASGWFSKPMMPPLSSSSEAAPTEVGEEEASDIFTTDRPGRGSDTHSPNTGAGSALYTGAASNIFVEDREENRSAAGESNLLADNKDERGSSINDDASKSTDRVNFELPNLPRGAQPSNIGSSAGDLIVIPDEELAASGNNTMPAELEGIEFVDGNLSAHSGSNLFGEPGQFDMVDNTAEASAVNLSNPDINPSAAGPLSSIFDIPNANPDEQPSGAGRVNIDHIPAFGSSDEKTEAMLNLDLEGGPSSSVFSGDARSKTPDDSGLIEWANPDAGDESTYLAEYQRSHRFEADASSVELPGLDDSIEFGEANTGAGSASIFGPTSGRGRSLPKLPGEGSDPEFVVNKTVLASAVAAAAAGAVALQAKSASGSNASAGMPQPVMQPAPQRGSKILSGILGTMAGLALGVAGMSVLRDQNAAPQSIAGANPTPPAATTSAPPTTTPTAAPSVEPKTLLASGNVQAALAAYEKAGDTNEAKAGRGQARWMLRVRTAANSKQALQDGDAELKKAADDLKAVFDATSSTSTPEEQLLGARAALNLGLIREVAGKPAEALNIYQDAKRKYGGQFIKWFDAAILRIGVMRKNADGTPVQNFSQAAPAPMQLEDAERLASLSVVLMDFDPVQELDDEAGFHFWKAINRSTSWDQGKKAFDEAIRSLDDAKRAHDLQRKKMVGMGLNPISDPREQMFLRACDELKFYWQFKGQLYGDPTGMAIARGGNGVAGKGTGGILSDLLAAKKSYDGVAAKVASADKALLEAKAAGEALVAANKKLEDLAAEKKQATDAAAKAEAELKTATDLATKAKTDLADAQGKLKIADSAVDAVIARLKSAKLIDEKTTRTEAVASLPELTKKMAVVASGSNETNELTRQLTEAQSQLKTAQTKLKEAETAALTTKADVEKKVKEATASLMAKTTDLENKVKLADENAKAEAKKAADAARAEMETKLADMKNAIQKVQTESADKLQQATQQLAVAKTAVEDEKRIAQAKLAAQAEQYRSQLAAVKSGATVQLIEADRVALDRASKGYQDGVEAFFNGQYSEGINSLSAASKDDPTDARIWYYLGLCRWNLGDQTGATADFRRGAALEARGKPSSNDVGLSLQRIQGSLRSTLDQFRP